MYVKKVSEIIYHIALIPVVNEDEACTELGGRARKADTRGRR